MIRKKKKLLSIIIFSFIVALLLAFGGFYFRFNSVYNFHDVSGASMQPTLNKVYTDGKKADSVYVKKKANLKHNDMVVFEKSLKNNNGVLENMMLIKRVIAIEGDELKIDLENIKIKNVDYECYVLKVKYKGTKKWVNPKGQYVVKLGETEIENTEYLLEKSKIDAITKWNEFAYDFVKTLIKEDKTLKLKKGEIFAMGDNRDNSTDSRFFGVIKKKSIEGRVDFVVKGAWSKTQKFFYNIKIKFILK